MLFSFFLRGGAQVTAGYPRRGQRLCSQGLSNRATPCAYAEGGACTQENTAIKPGKSEGLSAHPKKLVEQRVE